jgi:hypothetical protein
MHQCCRTTTNNWQRLGASKIVRNTVHAAAACAVDMRRGVHVLDVADVALDLHHPESPAAAAAATKAHALAAAGKAAALQSQAMPMLPHAGGAGGGFSTPRGGKQSLADALKEAKEKCVSTNSWSCTAALVPDLCHHCQHVCMLHMGCIQPSQLSRTVKDVP